MYNFSSWTDRGGNTMLAATVECDGFQSCVDGYQSIWLSVKCCSSRLWIKKMRSSEKSEVSSLDQRRKLFNAPWLCEKSETKDLDSTDRTCTTWYSNTGSARKKIDHVLLGSRWRLSRTAGFLERRVCRDRPQTSRGYPENMASSLLRWRNSTEFGSMSAGRDGCTGVQTGTCGKFRRIERLWRSWKTVERLQEQNPEGVGELSARYISNVQEFSDHGDPEHHRGASQR